MFNFIHVLSNRLLQVEWFKGMFGEKEEILEDVGEVFVETPKDISEPIISFVECVKNNPRRFKSKQEVCLQTKEVLWLITDKVEKISWKIKVPYRRNIPTYFSCDTYFTPDEKELLWRVFKECFNNQKKVKEDLRLKRGMAKRERLKTIYCKEEV